MFSLVSGKMSHQRHIPLLKHDVQHVMWYWGFDNSITVAAILHVSWQDWWPHDRISTRVMTRPRNSWLMDTSLRPAEVITAENAQQATACSHVWTLSSLLVWQSWINTPSKSFLPSADLFLLGAKAQNPVGGPLVVFYKKKKKGRTVTGDERGGESRSSQGRFSVTV